MKLKISKLTSVFLLCFASLIFFQCNSEDTNLVSNDVAESYVVYELNSSSLSDFLKADRTDFSHLVMRIKDGIPLFQKATLNEEGISMYEEFIDADGQIQSINQGTQFQYWQEDFQYAYVPLNEIESLLTQSEKITLIGEETITSQARYFTLQLNGDFKYSNRAETREEGDDGVDLKPCPEDCPPDNGGG